MIRFFLFFGMAWSERHPGVMFALLFLLICAAGALDAAALP